MNGWVGGHAREYAISSRVYMGVKLSVINFCASALIPRSTYMTSFLRILQRDTSTPLPTLLPWPCKHSWFGFISNAVSHVSWLHYACTHPSIPSFKNTLMPQPCSFTHTRIYVNQKTRSYTQMHIHRFMIYIIYTYI